MTAFTTLVTYACPRETRPGGCSLTDCAGVSHETDGSAPRLAARRNAPNGSTSSPCRSSCTVSNHGSGFQIPGVAAFCPTALHSIASSAQSGCEPLKT
jgi:hypothetical protein